jgi:hypothetical protein
MARNSLMGLGFGGLLFVIILTVFGAIGWVMNIIKFTQCDFLPPYKCESIRAMGLIPVVGAIVGYINISDVKK